MVAWKLKKVWMLRCLSKTYGIIKIVDSYNNGGVKTMIHKQTSTVNINTNSIEQNRENCIDSSFMARSVFYLQPICYTSQETILSIFPIKLVKCSCGTCRGFCTESWNDLSVCWNNLYSYIIKTLVSGHIHLMVLFSPAWVVVICQGIDMSYLYFFSFQQASSGVGSVISGCPTFVEEGLGCL